MVACVLREERIDAIWATVPPFNLLEIAALASRLSGRPWIADFRDAWQFVPNLFVRLTLPMRLNYERHLLESAAAVTAVSKGLAETLEKRHRRRVCTISHGFDPELCTQSLPKRTSKFSIVFTGGLVLGRPNFRPLLDAIARLVARGEMDSRDVSIEFYGSDNAARLADMFSGHPYAHLIVDHGYVPRMEAIEHQRNATVLLAAGHPSARGVITSKLFEYITAGRPILAIPRDGDCIDEMLNETNSGISCTSVEEIERALSIFYLEWKSNGSVAHCARNDVISRYSSRNRASDLAQLLDKVANGDE